MSSKSEYKGQLGWKPAGFRSMGPIARAQVREDKKDWEDRARRARRKALGLPEKVEGETMVPVEQTLVTPAQAADIATSMEPQDASV